MNFVRVAIVVLTARPRAAPHATARCRIFRRLVRPLSGVRARVALARGASMRSASLARRRRRLHGTGLQNVDQMLQPSILLLLRQLCEKTLARQQNLSYVAPDIKDSITAVSLHLLSILNLTVLALLCRTDMRHPGHTGHTLDGRRRFLWLNLGKPIVEKTLRSQLVTKYMRLLLRCSKELMELWLDTRIR